MIPVEFDYVRVSSVDEAVQALGSAEDAKLLAGGHSLLPLMKLRLAYPETLVDIGRVEEMRGIRDDGDRLVIGASTTHHDVVTSDLVRQHCGVLSDVTAKVGDPQVRHRGTHGGSLAHGDAASDMPGMALALDARLTIAGPGGRRTVEASDFFIDYLETAVGEDEVLVEVSWPKLAAGTRWNYQKFTRVTQGWAIVGALAVVTANGSISEARVGLTNMGSVPVRASAVEQALAGVATDDSGAIAAAAEQAAEGNSAPTDLNADPAYREHLARVLTRRAVTAAVG
ncbi:xanthine dehydrogenase family protein subunit M [soil metagenome]